MTPEDKEIIKNYFNEHMPAKFEADHILHYHCTGRSSGMFSPEILGLKDSIYNIILDIVFFWLPETLSIKETTYSSFYYEDKRVTKENYQDINRKIQKKYHKMEEILGQSFGEFVVRRIEDERL